jgi:dihydroflavonol-4-reductase
MTIANNFNRILVTGGAGFIGSHLVQQLVHEHQTVRVLEKPGASISHLPLDKVEVIFADLRDMRAVSQATLDCDLVLHLAANPNLWARDPHEFEQVNHQGTRRVLTAAREAGARRVVYVSTESILAPRGFRGIINEDTQTSLEDMLGPYCRSKWLAEDAARQAALAGQPVIIVRPTIPVGPGDRLRGPPSRMICDFCNGRIRACLDAQINLIDVRDIAAGIWAAAQRGEAGRPYLLANENWRILDLLRCLAGLVGRPAPRWRVPYRIALLFAHLEEWFCTRVSTRRQPMATVTGVKLTQRSLRFDGTVSARALGWQPALECRRALDEAVQWFRAAGCIHSFSPAPAPFPRQVREVWLASPPSLSHSASHDALLKP